MIKRSKVKKKNKHAAMVRQRKYTQDKERYPKTTCLQRGKMPGFCPSTIPSVVAIQRRDGSQKGRNPDMLCRIIYKEVTEISNPSAVSDPDAFAITGILIESVDADC